MFDRDLVIIDVETTGISPLYERVIELAMIRISKNKIVDKFTTLINPQKQISPFISSFTGITNEELEDAPIFEDIKDRIIEMLAGAVFVAHNVRFDYSFIKTELKRIGVNYKAKTFCTVRLSRRLYPEHRSHSLESVIARFNFKFINRHRAYDDAFVLWQFLQKIKKTIPKQTLLKAWADLTKSLYSVNDDIKTQVDALPETSGVYIFYNKDNEVLYVGKSKNISDRVVSHFSQDVTSTKHLNLIKEIVRIGHLVTTGELGALLLESQLIKELHPIYNARLLDKKEFVVLTKELKKNGYWTLKSETVKSLTEVDTDNLLGAFKNKRAVKEYLEAFADKYKLCKKVLGLESGKGSCFAYKLKKCRGACLKKEKKQIYNSRFLIAFIESRQFRPWPHKGLIEIMEKNKIEDKWESYIVDNWCLIGKKNNVGDEEKFSPVFDPDIYRIIERYLRNNNPSFRKI
ncbi:MAG: exonuclease domain-containing protein [Patescibacteria group bacterium]|jgi:DNA polymerase-3 subunit epsilon